MRPFLFILVALVAAEASASGQCPNGCCPCPQPQAGPQSWSPAATWSAEVQYRSPPIYFPRPTFEPPQVYYLPSPQVVIEVEVPGVREFRQPFPQQPYGVGRGYNGYQAPAYGGFDAAGACGQAAGFRAAPDRRYRQVTRTRTR